MERAQYLDVIGVESGAFCDAVRAATAATGWSTPVPSCPPWDLGELTYHVGLVQHFWAEMVGRGLSKPAVESPPRPPDPELVAWVGSQTAALLPVLSEAAPKTPVWTAGRPGTVAFVIRRIALELAVHRFDAQQAAGTMQPIERELAVEGVDEYLFELLPRARAHVQASPSSTPGTAAGLDGSVHLHATDGPGEWLVREGDGGNLLVTAEHAKGDAAVRGPASDLLLLLWRRVGLDDLEVFGDRDVAGQFVAGPALG